MENGEIGVEIFAALRGERASRRMRQAADIVYIAAVTLAGALLFTIDVTQPRGVVDGVGYSAVVALTSRFGRTALLGAAVITSILTLLGAAIVPDAGISVAGMWANRVFALAAIWVVALIMQSRMELEADLRARETNLRRHEEALGTMIRASVLPDIDLEERLREVCQIGTLALGGMVGIVGVRNDDNETVTVLQSWRKPPSQVLRPPGSTMYVDRHHRAMLARDFVAAIDDIETAELEPHTRTAARAHGARAMLSAEVLYGWGRNGLVVFGREDPHAWSEEEKSFARAVANLVGLLLSNENNIETLAALELTDDGIYTEDPAGRVRYSNRAARLFARGQDDGSFEFPRPKAPLPHGHDRHAIHFQNRDLEIYRARLPGGGLIARLADVTARNQATVEKARLEERLQQSAKMEAIGQLAGGVAHDFNNILGAITGFAGFIAQDGGVDSENRDFAQRILAASKRGKEMVEQIMAFAETRAVSHGVTNLGRALQRCQELLANAMQPGAMLEVDLPQEPLLVRGNEVQIGQMIANLALNARDALNGGGGSIEIGSTVAAPQDVAGFVNFTGTPDERLVGEPRSGIRYARVTVRDTGNGIAPDIFDRIFEPFFTTKGRQRGTGLGLAVVHGVVRGHGGFLHVRSGTGRGTTFSVYLPMVAETQAAATPATAQPCRVLIVDDEADMADMLSIALERLGHQTVAVLNPVAALAAIEEDPGAFDALLTDQLMPFMRGTELIHEAKRVAPNLRAVLCTGHAESLSEDEALAMGADTVLPKPVDIQAVVAALRGAGPAESS
jgi:signal transduction histidine kinase/ActR/RegA family two-component response regulator